MTYSATGKLLSSADPLWVTHPAQNPPSKYSYDAAGNELTKTDPDGYVTTDTYDAAGRLIKTVDPNDNVTTYGYDALGEQTSVTVAYKGTSPATTATTSTVYDSLGRKVAVTNADGDTTTYGYDLDGNETSVTDANGHTTSSVYNKADELISTTDAAGDETSYTYDPAGNKLTEVAPNGNVSSGNAGAYTTRWAYDKDGRVSSETEGLTGSGVTPRVTSYTYDKVGNTASMTDARGYTTTYLYDADNELLSTSDPAAQVTSTTYNADGLKLTSTDGDGHVTSYAYDADSRLVSVTNDTLKETTSYGYDADGRQIAVTDPRGYETQYDYDGDGNLVKTTYADGSTQQQSFDNVGDLLSVTNGDNQTTSYAYDPAGRLLSEKDPLGRVTSYTYDPAGNETSITDAMNRVTTLAYDPANRLASLSYSSSGTHDITYAYDPDGERTSMTDGSGTTTSLYDPFGELTSETNGAGATVTYGYDADGDLSTLGYPNLGKVTYSYDHADELASVTDWLGHTTSYDYDNAGNPTSEMLGNGDSITSSYDAANQVSSITLPSGSTSLIGFSYTRNPDENVTQELATGAINKTTTYAYDKLDRVVGQGTSSFSYDAAGHITGLSSGASQTYDAAGQLEAQVAPNGGGTTNFTYDALGERTAETPPSGSPTTYSYDQAGHLTSISAPSSSMSYGYNGDGLRMSETTSAGTEQFTWDTAASTPQLLEDSTNAYIYGLGNAPIEQVNLSSGAVSYLVTDSIGSVRAILNSSGSVGGTCSYDAYGTPTTTGGLTASTPFGFAGGYTDPTGLIYLIARYYDPSTGQFLSVDPLLGMTRQAYVYAADNPTDQVDPLGLKPKVPKTSKSVSDDYLKEHVNRVSQLGQDPETDSATPEGAADSQQLYSEGLALIDEWIQDHWYFKTNYNLVLERVPLANGEEAVICAVSGDRPLPEDLADALANNGVEIYQADVPGLHAEQVAQAVRLKYGDEMAPAQDLYSTNTLCSGACPEALTEAAGIRGVTFEAGDRGYIGGEIVKKPINKIAPEYYDDYIAVCEGPATEACAKATEQDDKGGDPSTDPEGGEEAPAP